MFDLRAPRSWTQAHDGDLPLRRFFKGQRAYRLRTSADAFPLVGGRCAGRAPAHCQAGPSSQDGAEVWIPISTVVRFLGGVESESFPMQDEPERRTSFQHKMSLKA